MVDRASLASFLEDLVASSSAEWPAVVSQLLESRPNARARLAELAKTLSDLTRPANASADSRAGGSFINCLLDRYGDELLEGASFTIGVPEPDELAFDERFAASDTALERYRLGREVARGGMGRILEVWDQDIERPLAMKVAGSGQALSPRFLRRFVREAKITGQLDHPGVVPVHDLGIDAEGQVYFTMRLVHGRDLREVFRAAREEREGWNRARGLEVLLKVCDTVAFAHAQGVIHRDLKPANVMVGDYGEVYVMDWGLAKVVGDPEPRSGDEAFAEREAVDSEPAVTVAGTVMGTVEYMSPEQARGETAAIGPCTDVHAVGAMLHELLFGRSPYQDPEEPRSTHELLVAIRTDAPRIGDGIVGDVPEALEAICQRALARDPGARYPDTAALAAELRRYLEAEGRAQEEAARARKEARQAREVVEFLLRLFEVENPQHAKTHRLTVLEVLARGSEKLRDQPISDVVTRATLFQTLADLFARQGEYQEALPLARQAMELHRQQVGRDPREFVRSLSALALLETRLGHFAEAEPLLDEALTRAREAFGEVHAEVASALENRATLDLDRGEPNEAERYFRACLEQRRALFGARDPAVATSLNNLGLALSRQGRAEEAVECYEASLDIRREALGSRSAEVASTLHNLGALLVNQGRFTRAEPICREALTIREAVLGRDHFETYYTRNNLAVLLYGRGEFAGAVMHYEGALACLRHAVGEHHPQVARCLRNLAIAYRDLGRLDEARECLEAGFAEFRRHFPPGDRQAGIYLCGLGSIDQLTGDLDRAAERYREALALQSSREDSSFAKTLLWSARLHLERGEHDDAESKLRHAIRVLGRARHSLAEAKVALAECLLAAGGDRNEARALLDEALGLTEEDRGAEHPLCLQARALIARV